MITLFTTLFVGLYWLFTNTILLPTFTTNNVGLIPVLFFIELCVEVVLCAFAEIIQKIGNKKNDAR